MKSHLISLAVLTALVVIACANETQWIRASDKAYVTCHIADYQNSLDYLDAEHGLQEADYWHALTHAGTGLLMSETTCPPPEPRAYKSYEEYMACVGQVADVYRQHYKGLSQQAAKTIEENLDLHATVPCWPNEGYPKDLPNAPIP